MGYEIIIKINEGSFVVIPVKDFEDLKRVLSNYERIAKFRSVRSHEK